MDYRLILSLVGIDVFLSKHGQEIVLDDVAEILEKKRWTIDLPSKRKKVDYRLTHQHIYIYIYTCMYMYRPLLQMVLIQKQNQHLQKRWCLAKRNHWANIIFCMSLQHTFGLSGWIKKFYMLRFTKLEGSFCLWK